MSRDGYISWRQVVAGGHSYIVKEAQSTLIMLEYIWTCLSDDCIVSSCLDKFVVKSEWIFQR